MYELHQSIKALNVISSQFHDGIYICTFTGELTLQAISPILTLAGILTPLPKGIGNTRPAPAVHPVALEDVGALYGLLPGAVVGAAIRMGSKLDSWILDPTIAACALQTILVALQNKMATVLEDITDNMFWDAAGANNLMYA